MKKLLLCLIAVISFGTYAQVSIQVTDNGTVIPANATISAVTTAGGNTKVYLDITNTSASTKSYTVKRYDVQLNADATTTASAYFCFAGNCFIASTYTAGPLTLNAGQSASQLAGSFNMLTTDLDEANTVGQSVVKYTFYNANTASDSVQVSIVYNGVTGINEISNPVSSFGIFPNPVNENSAVKINCTKAVDGKFCIYNALGAIISEKSVSLNEGKNKIDFNAESLPSGIYFANIKFGNTSTTRKFIVK